MRWARGELVVGGSAPSGTFHIAHPCCHQRQAGRPAADSGAVVGLHGRFHERQTVEPRLLSSRRYFLSTELNQELCTQQRPQKMPWRESCSFRSHFTPTFLFLPRRRASEPACAMWRKWPRDKPITIIPGRIPCAPRCARRPSPAQPKAQPHPATPSPTM